MSKFEFKLPDIGEGVAEGEIVNWLVREGDAVSEDQDMVEVMTDKATVTIGAPRTGTIAELRAKVGEVVPVGHVLVVFDLQGDAASSPPGKGDGKAQVGSAAEVSAEARKTSESAATAVGDIRDVLPGTGIAQAARVAGVQETPLVQEGGYFNDKPLAAPATRKLARELGVDLKRVPPSGTGGRVTREDVARFQSAGGAASAAAAPARRAASSLAPGAQSLPVPSTETERREPIQGIRRRIYENMARSKHTAAHFTYVDECDATALKALRERSQSFAEHEGVKLSFLPFIVKAVVAALKKHPALNCLVDDTTQEMVFRNTFDIGVAMATEAGLTVPVLRRADRLSVLEIGRELDRLGEAARAGHTRMQDLGGSSFTITSLGKLGGLFATPIVNYPEVAILGVHEIKRRPVVRGDEIVIGDVMLLSLSFDHRIIDGHIGAGFARTIIEYLEEPDRLLLAMS